MFVMQVCGGTSSCLTGMPKYTPWDIMYINRKIENQLIGFKVYFSFFLVIFTDLKSKASISFLIKIVSVVGSDVCPFDASKD